MLPAAAGSVSSVFVLLFFSDGDGTQRFPDLIPASTGWDPSTNTFSSVLSISEIGVGASTGEFKGGVHADARLRLLALAAGSVTGP